MNQRGYILTLATVFFVFIIGVFLILMIDFSRAYIVRSQLRTMTDAAALSASHAYETADCPAPCADWLVARRDAAYAAAQMIADNNSILGIGPINLGGEAGIDLGYYTEDNQFLEQDPLDPVEPINAARVRGRLGEYGNPVFNTIFGQLVSDSVGQSLSTIQAEATGTMKIDEKTLLVALALDSSGSMAYNKYCARSSWAPCSYGNENINPACEGVQVGDVWVTCPPIWEPGTPTDPPCGSNWTSSKFPTWCNNMPSRTYPNHRLPSNARWPYSDMRWVPQPMYSILQAANIFVDEIEGLNEEDVEPIYKHQVGVVKFTSGSDSQAVINPTTTYANVHSILTIQTIYPMYATDVCRGFSLSFTMLQNAWTNYPDDKDRSAPVIVLISDINESEPNRVCDQSPPNGTQGRAQTLARVDQFDNNYYNLTGKRVIIFTIMVMNEPPVIKQFMQQLARNGGEYVFAPNEDEIEEAFRRVVQKIQTLRLVR